MVCHPAPEGEAPATGRDIKALDLADETRDPASIHPYDGPVPLAARSDLVGSVCCQRLEVTCHQSQVTDLVTKALISRPVAGGSPSGAGWQASHFQGAAAAEKSEFCSETLIDR